MHLRNINVEWRSNVCQRTPAASYFRLTHRETAESTVLKEKCENLFLTNEGESLMNVLFRFVQSSDTEQTDLREVKL
jgi:hypothetical protein